MSVACCLPETIDRCKVRKQGLKSLRCGCNELNATAHKRREQRQASIPSACCTIGTAAWISAELFVLLSLCVQSVLRRQVTLHRMSHGPHCWSLCVLFLQTLNHSNEVQSVQKPGKVYKRSKEQRQSPASAG